MRVTTGCTVVAASSVSGATEVIQSTPAAPAGERPFEDGGLEHASGRVAGEGAVHPAVEDPVPAAVGNAEDVRGELAVDGQGGELQADRAR